MDDTTFDKALIAAAFAQIGARGWHRLDLVAASREAGLDVARTRARFPGRCALLLRFGSLADQAALSGALADGPVRDRLFDMLMRRIDALQGHRAGVIALLRALPTDPATAMLLASASLRSMGWMLKGAGTGAGAAAGPLLGLARAKALLAVWLWTVRAWQRDESEDLSATMAALDQALSRAEQAESWLHRREAAPVAAPPVEAPPAEVTPAEAAPPVAPDPGSQDPGLQDPGPQADPDPPG